MKLDDIDRERYTLAMFALGMAYAMARGVRRGRPPDDEQMAELDRLVQRVYDFNNEWAGAADKEEP